LEISRFWTRFLFGGSIYYVNHLIQIALTQQLLSYFSFGYGITRKLLNGACHIYENRRHPKGYYYTGYYRYFFCRFILGLLKVYEICIITIIRFIITMAIVGIFTTKILVWTSYRIEKGHFLHTSEEIDEMIAMLVNYHFIPNAWWIIAQFSILLCYACVNDMHKTKKETLFDGHKIAKEAEKNKTKFSTVRFAEEYKQLTVEMINAYENNKKDFLKWTKIKWTFMVIAWMQPFFLFLVSYFNPEWSEIRQFGMNYFWNISNAHSLPFWLV